MIARFTSRASVRIKDNYYTFEACIERSCPDDISDAEYEQFKKDLWDEVTDEVDKQVIDTENFLKSKQTR